VKPVVGKKTERRVPAYAVHKNTSWLSPGAQRAKNQMTGQQKKEKVQAENDRRTLQQELAKLKKENDALLVKHNLSMAACKTMEAERAAIERVVFSRDGKMMTGKAKPMVEGIIEVVRGRIATETEALEKEAKRLGRHVSQREKQIELLESRLKKTLAESLRDAEKKKKRKNLALKEVRSSKAEADSLRWKLLEANERVTRLVESLKELKNEKEKVVSESLGSAVLATRTKKKGRPYSDEFEAFVVRCLAGGISAPQLRNQLLHSKDYFLKDQSEEERDRFEVPEINWFNRMRERVGTESLCYAFVKIAGADEVLQYGNDETGMDDGAQGRRGTLNQWAKTRNKDGTTGVVTIEAGGILVGGTAEEVTAHVEETWDRGQAGVDALRLRLGDDADRLAPLVNGGANLLKIRSLMHDTCNTANATAKKIAELVQSKGEQFYGTAAWQALPEEDRCVLDFLCGNHTRGLPVDAFNRLFMAFQSTQLCRV